MELELSVGGRRRENYESFKERWTEGADVPNFVEIDHSNEASINRALTMKPWNLILHTAGPFQRVKEPRILKEALRLRLPYVDVCDDTDLCKVAKCLAESAASDGVPAVVSAGIWPGVSALMVCEAHERLGDIEDLTMSFYTSGTGGAGATIVSATFLLLAEPPLNYKDGHAVRAEAWGNRRKVDFGAGVGEQPVHLLDEPEVYTCHEHLQIPNVSSSFGTAPDIWNWMFAACAKALPAEILANRSLMQNVAVFSMPIITAVDRLVGSKNAMRIDARSRSGEEVTLRVTHEDLEDCVGLATAAFSLEVLEGRAPRVARTRRAERTGGIQLSASATNEVGEVRARSCPDRGLGWCRGCLRGMWVQGKFAAELASRHTTGAGGGNVAAGDEDSVNAVLEALRPEMGRAQIWRSLTERCKALQDLRGLAII